jgi:Tfp pilus assembly protein PilE
MALRLVGLLVTLVLMAWAATALRPSFAPADESKQQVPEALLQQAGLALERAHQLTGTYQGAQSTDASSSVRLAAADAAGYCLELTWIGGKLYHLRGPGGRPAEGQC